MNLRERIETLRDQYKTMLERPMSSDPQIVLCMVIEELDEALAQTGDNHNHVQRAIAGEE